MNASELISLADFFPADPLKGDALPYPLWFDSFCTPLQPIRGNPLSDCCGTVGIHSGFRPGK